MYSLLLLGVVFGFTLSTIIQTLNVDFLRHSSPRLQRQEPYLNAPEGREVAFSNLKRESQEVEEDPEFGDYGYDGDPEERESPRVVVAEKVHVEVPARDPHKAASVVRSPESLKLRMRKYQSSQNWQGRNVMQDDSNNNGLPPNKLSDELPTRETVLVAIITSVTQLMTQTLSVQGTWAPQASQVVFFVGDVDIMPHLPHGMIVIELEGVDDRIDNWKLKEISAIKYLMDHYLDRTDWFLVIGDQTYVVTDHLEKKLNTLDASLPVYMGLAGDPLPNGKGLLCKRDPGIVYSRTLLEGLRPYLPACWPGVGGVGDAAAREGGVADQEGAETDTTGSSLTGCIAEMGVKCTQAKEVSWGVKGQ